MNENRKVPGPDDNQDPTTAEIKTVADLEAVYPELVLAVREEVIEKIEGLPIKKIRLEFPDLYQRVAKAIGQSKIGPDMSKPGFLLEESFFVKGESGHMDKHKGDPFSVGTLRCYLRQKNLEIGTVELPFVLAFDDVFSRASLENYILRAEGACDQVRADKAKAALARCK